MSDSRAECVVALRRLTEWAVSVDVAGIPEKVLQRAARVLADDLAAIVGARDEPEVRAFHERTLRRAGVAEATVFRGGRSRTDRISAAVANALAADWLELDEGYRPTSCHAGLYVIPALLAESEARNLRFGEMLRALILSYEITTRLARAWKLRRQNIQPHGRFAAVGTAAGIALTRAPDGQLLVASLGTAVTLSGLSPRSHLAEGILSRNVWPAAGAWAGMMSVEWAECGIGGTLSAFYDAYGALLGGLLDARVLVEDLGDEWGILDGYTKIYACCQHLHSAVEAALALQQELPADSLDTIEAITVATHPLALQLREPSPTTTLGAKFSMPHAVAAGLLLGSGGAEAFATSTLADPAIQALRTRVMIEPYAPELPPPNDRPSRVVVRLRDGRSFRKECLSALGGPDRPLPADTVFSKVETLAGPVYPGMRKTMERLSDISARDLARGWADILEELA